MRQRIIFFDIDRTLFNSENFLEDFYKKLNEVYGLSEDEILKIKDLYHKSKIEKGYFSPDIFLRSISNSFLNIEIEKLKIHFYSLIQENLYEDNQVLFDIAKFSEIGFFSKGDLDFQKRKIEKFNKIFDPRDVYILSNKISQIEKVFQAYSNFKIYLVDDEVEVLRKVAENLSFVTGILMDRKKNKIKDGKIQYKVQSLNEILNIVYE